MAENPSTPLPFRRSAQLRHAMRPVLILAILAGGIGLLAACGKITFDRETGQFSVPLGGDGDGVGSNR